MGIKIQCYYDIIHFGEWKTHKNTYPIMKSEIFGYQGIRTHQILSRCVKWLVFRSAIQGWLMIRGMKQRFHIIVAGIGLTKSLGEGNGR